LYILGRHDEQFLKLIPCPEAYYVKKFTANLQKFFIDINDIWAMINFLRTLVQYASPAINEHIVIVCLENLKRCLVPVFRRHYLLLLLEIAKTYPHYLETMKKREDIIYKAMQDLQFCFPKVVEAWKSFML